MGYVQDLLAVSSNLLFILLNILLFFIKINYYFCIFFYGKNESKNLKHPTNLSNIEQIFLFAPNSEWQRTRLNVCIKTHRIIISIFVGKTQIRILKFKKRKKTQKYTQKYYFASKHGFKPYISFLCAQVS